MPGIDGSVVDFFLDNRCWWRRRRLCLAEHEKHWNPRIGANFDDLDRRLRLRALGPTAKELFQTLGRIEQVEQEAAFAFGFGFGSVLAVALNFAGDIGPRLGRTGLPRFDYDVAAAMMSRLTADSAVRKIPST